MAAVWLDNNRTGPFARRPLAALVAWAQASAGLGVAAGHARDNDLLKRAKAALAAGCGFSLEGAERYEVVFTSGAEESVSTLIASVVSAFVKRTKMVGGVVVGGAEDLYTTARAATAHLVAEKRAEVTLLPLRGAGDPSGGGTYEPSVVKAALKENTCVVSLQAAHLSTGAISNIRMIKQAVGPAIPLHVDMSLIFGRVAISVESVGLDAVTLDFHRIGGPPGIGALVLKRKFIDGYGLRPCVFGKGPQLHRRGGVLAPGALAGALEAFRALASADRRKEWGRRVVAMRELARRLLSAEFPVAPLGAYVPGAAVQLVFLSPASRADARHVLPNTLLFSLGHRRSVDRAKVDADLRANGIRVHVPSDAVLSALDLEPTLFAGALGVCAGPRTTEAELAALVAALADAVRRGVGVGAEPEKGIRRARSFPRPT